MNARSFMALYRSGPALDADAIATDERLMREIKADNDAAEIVRTQVRDAVASHKRRAAVPNPTVEITLDLGEFGEIPATVEYEGIQAESGDYFQPSTPAHLIIYSVIARDFGELLPGIEKQHRDVLAGVVEKVEAVLRGGK